MAINSIAIVDDSVEIYKGSTMRLKYQFLDDGVPYNLTGASGVAKFAKKDYSSVVFTATVTITDAANGKLEVVLTDTATAAATPVPSGSAFSGPAEQYELLVFDVRLSITGGDKLLKIRGTAKFYPTASGM